MGTRSPGGDSRKDDSSEASKASETQWGRLPVGGARPSGVHARRRSQIQWGLAWRVGITRNRDVNDETTSCLGCSRKVLSGARWRTVTSCTLELW